MNENDDENDSDDENNHDNEDNKTSGEYVRFINALYFCPF